MQAAAAAKAGGEENAGREELNTLKGKENVTRLCRNKGGENGCLEELWMSRKTVEGEEPISLVPRDSEFL